MISKKLHHAAVNRLQAIMGNIDLALHSLPSNGVFGISERADGEIRARLQKAKSEIRTLTRVLSENIAKRDR